MKQIEKTASATNFTAINLGKLNELGDYLLELAPEIKIPGKVFGGAALQATGSEFSFQLFQPGTETGFLHTHQTHEELYFFLSGNGEFQVDGQVFPVSEGSVVRVRLLIIAKLIATKHDINFFACIFLIDTVSHCSFKFFRNIACVFSCYEIFSSLPKFWNSNFISSAY